MGRTIRKGFKQQFRTKSARRQYRNSSNQPCKRGDCGDGGNYKKLFDMWHLGRCGGRISLYDEKDEFAKRVNSHVKGQKWKKSNIKVK